MRRTRILATVGPASQSDEMIAALLSAGTDAFRLNFSHGTREAHADTCRRIRAAATAAGRTTAILQDLAGPKFRVGEIPAPLALAAGDALAIEQGHAAGDAGRVTCDMPSLFTSVPAGARLLLDDGRIELEVTTVTPGRLETRVITGGMLESRKSINVPGVALRASALTPKDADDLRAGIAMGVDLVAVSFVQTADDLRAVRAAAAAAGAPDLPLIAKIEKPQAVESIDEILGVADGLMVARGDLGIEVPLETLPAVQRRLIDAARRRGVPAIVATQVLESMRLAPRPTRAEVTDAAHAVDQGADGILLAGETAIGQYPVQAVSMLDAIIREAERAAVTTPRPGSGPGAAGDHARALCEAAVALADETRADAIVAVTGAGTTARLLAALRPRARILAATPNAATAARLTLVWGVTPVITSGAVLPAVRDALLGQGLVPAGTVVVFVSIHPILGREDANFIHIERL